MVAEFRLILRPLFVGERLQHYTQMRKRFLIRKRLIAQDC